MTSPPFTLAAFTDEQLRAARLFAAQPFVALAASVRSGETLCRNPEAWAIECDKAADDIVAGRSDHVFATYQRMRLHLTGECVPLLAPAEEAQAAAA